MSIKIDNLSFSYGQKAVLNDISFSAEKGEFLSVLGPNGAGKSTLFRCILGLIQGYSGKVLVDGKNIKDFSVREASKHIAYIPQSSHSVFHYSASDIVLMGRTNNSSLFASPTDKDEEICLNALKKVGIEHLKERCFHKLSGGERQLVLIARALAQDAPILLLDEPTANLDFGNQMLVMKEATKLAKDGYTIIQTTHNPEQSYLFSDRIIALKHGSVIADGKPSDVMTEKLMKDLYDTDVNISSLYDDTVRVCIPREFIKQGEEL